MKEISSRFIFILIDLAGIFISIILAYLLRYVLSDFFSRPDSYGLDNYTSFYPLYFIVLSLFTYEGIYSHRYDFWHESRIIIKSLLFGFLMVLAYLAITKSIQNYSRAVITFSFIFMAFLLPLFKNIVKKSLFKLGIWRRSAFVYNNDEFLKQEVFSNPYLGYVESKEEENPKTIFLNASISNSPSHIDNKINTLIKNNQEIIIIPFLNNYDLTYAHIYQLFNTRKSLIVFQNRLKSHYRIWLKKFIDMVFTACLLPILIPMLTIIALLVKKEEPGSNILFKQKRLGEKGDTFTCYKFRTMYEKSDEILHEYLKKHPEEITYYKKFHKYKNDPRITKIGKFLRKTSLDELPQIINIIKLEMSFVGPRPYMLEEKDKMNNEIETILSVPPGITGLWQVSGRNNVDFDSRVDLDVWYINNWNLWIDLVILVKTVKIVLTREGAN